MECYGHYQDALLCYSLLSAVCGIVDTSAIAFRSFLGTFFVNLLQEIYLFMLDARRTEPFAVATLGGAL